MSELTLKASGPDGIRREFPLLDANYVVGRADGTQDPQKIPIEGDGHLSRAHFRVELQEGQLLVEKLPSGRNPLFFQGEERQRFTILPGQVFYTGKTQFSLSLSSVVTTAMGFTLAQETREKARLRRVEDCLKAVMSLLTALRTESEREPWLSAFPVVKDILPDVSQVAFVQVAAGDALPKILGSEPAGKGVDWLNAELLQQALEGRATATSTWETPVQADSAGTLGLRYTWAIASPTQGVESATFLLCATGASVLERSALEERAAILDLIAELVGHHQVTRQAAEFSSLLGVFGHHVGTLFKTSGALGLWTDNRLTPELQRVFGNLLPIWGISQAISLHKKGGEKENAALLYQWVCETSCRTDDLQSQVIASLVAFANYVHQSREEAPFLKWTVQGEQPGLSTGLLTLPPLNDSPKLFDKTLAFTMGLLEMLNNVRKYPEARGAGREDRRELKLLSEEERLVTIECRGDGAKAQLVMTQPVVTAPDGSIPQSRSLSRIRAMESRLLRGWVDTGAPEVIGATDYDHILKVQQVWSFHWKALVDDWEVHHGAKT